MTLRLTLLDYRRRGSDIVGTVRAHEDDALVFTDGVNLSTAKGRGQFFAGLSQQLNGACPEKRAVEAQLLVLLQDAEEQLAQEQTEQTSTNDADEDLPAGPYRETPVGLLWLKPTRDGDAPTPLTNFTARIVQDTAEDDGSGELRRIYTLEARLGRRNMRFDVAAAQFATLGWAMEQLGAEAIVYPGFSARDHTRVAIQQLSGAIARRVVYAHTGWRQVGGEWVYLHASGAIGPAAATAPNGPIGSMLQTIEVHLAPPLDRVVLPAPPSGDALHGSVQALLAALTVAPDRLTVPLFGGVFRAAVGGVDFTLHLSGPTGVQKSELAALAQQCFGPSLDARHLPGSWSSTANALEAMTFTLKDCLCVVDDFAPTGSQNDVARLHREADRLLRAQGNRAGRARMRADTTLRAARPPRGLILSTGEDVPRGQSLRSRLVVLEVEPGDVALSRLTHCQQQAATGLYAQALAGFIQWLATHYVAVHQRLPAWEREQRQRALASDLHRRTPDNVAKLAAGWSLFLAFAIEAGAIGRAEAGALWQRAWMGLGAAAAAQLQYQQGSEPATRYLELIRGALVAGLAHVASVENDAPTDYRVWGWECRSFGDDRLTYSAKGNRIGWLDGDDLYLEPEVAYSVAQKLASSQGEVLAVGAKTLHKRLEERGLLRSTDTSRKHVLVRRTIDGHRHTVLHVSAAVLLPPASTQSTQSARDAEHDSEPGADEAAAGSIPWVDVLAPPAASTHDEAPESAHTTRDDDDGSRGSIGSISGTPESACREGACEPDNVVPHTAGSMRDTGAQNGRADPVAHAREERPMNDRDTEAAIDPLALPVTVIRTPEDLTAALPALLAAGVVGVDCETTGLDPLADRLRLIQLAAGQRVYVVDCLAVDPAPLTPVFARSTFVGHNLAFDLRFLLAHGLPVPTSARLFDTMLASQLLHSGLPEPKGTHTLAGVVARTLGQTLDKTLQLSDWSGPLTDAQIAYAATDAAILLPLAEELRQQLDAANLEQAAALEMRALPAIVWLEHGGAPFDQQRWLALADAAVLEQQRLEEALTRVSATADLFGQSSVKWSSPDQVAKLLRQRGHQVPSTNEYVLQGLVASEPLAPLLLQHREASRKASAYGVEFLRHVHAATGRLHAHYQQIGASSGRMACGNPNLQNIPRDPAYRACFNPALGRCLVKADYSQIELRIVAQVSQDTALLQAYRDGADVHVRTAAALMGEPEEQVSKQQRQLAKACDFGLLYGMGAPRLREYAASAYGVMLTENEAQTFRERFFQTYPGLRRWQRAQPNHAIETRTLAGRRRLGVEHFVDKLNLPIQGTGADILKLALARLWEDRASEPSALPVLCIHDEIVLECDVDRAEEVAAWLQHHMESAGTDLLPDVPVVADVTIAADWSGTPLRENGPLA